MIEMAALTAEVSEIATQRLAECALGKMTEGKIFDKPISEYDKPLAKELPPNTTYSLNENIKNIYKTDGQGRIISCEYIPKRTPENTRDNNAQISVGAEERKNSDQGGHLIGRDIGGDGGRGNLVAMDSRINQSGYKRMENDIKKDIDDGKDVMVKTEIEYSENSKRPDKITSTVTVDGKDTVYTFDNNIDGSLMEKLEHICNESDIAVLKDVLNETEGTVSSIKEEFDGAAKLEKTTALITYKDENGKNLYRTMVIDNSGGVS